jgi:hypothetical protein
MNLSALNVALLRPAGIERRAFAPFTFVIPNGFSR